MLNKEKLNANAVGAAAYSDPQTNKITKFDCRGGRLCPPANKQNGITLIALIITIIVMLILVGVTINVALNGGIFGKAETATRQTEEQSILEEMLAMMDVTNEGKIDHDTIIKKMKEKRGAENVEYAYPNATITGKLGTYNYIVSETEIRIGSSKSDVDEDLATYILGADGTGRNLMSIMNMEGATFLPDPDNAESTVYQNVKFGYGFDEDNMDQANGEIFGYIRYGRDVYKITADMNTADTKELTLINSPSGHLGEYVIYGGVNYIVMAEDSSTVTLISANALGTVPLGRNDAGAIAAVPTAGETATDAENGQRGVWSYNKAVNTLVTACKDETGLTVDGSTVISIRSAGNTNVKYTSSGISGTDAPGDYTYDYQTAGAESDWYTAKGFNNYHMKREDTNYSSDLNTMRQLGIPMADNGGRYWLASRRVYADTLNVDFYVRYVHGMGDLGYSDVCYVSAYGNVYGSDYSYAVRPVVTLSSGAISW